MGVLEPGLSRYFHTIANRKGTPLSGTFELSPCCNMDCRMCYVRKSRQEVEKAGGEIGPEQWLSMAEECRNAGMLFLLLTGGEPFFYPGFRELYKKLSKMGFLISINTNGTMISEKTVSWLQENPPARMNITLYGASDETYDKLCRNPSGYSRTVAAIQMLKEAGISVKLNASMTPYNIADLDGIYETARKLDVYVQATAYMYPPVRKNENNIGSGDRFPAEEAGKWEAVIDKKRLTDEQYKRRVQAIRERILTVQDKCQDMDNIPGEPMRCRAGKTSFWINWKGEMSPCGMMVKPIVYPFRDGLLPAWKLLREESKKILLPGKCSSCNKKELCPVCAASVSAETGIFDQTPEYLCRMTETKIQYTVENI